MHSFATCLALVLLAAACTAQTVQRRVIKNPDGSTTMTESWGHSSFNQESSDNDGIISGRSGYSDTAGNNYDTHYEIGPDGRMKVVDPKESKLKGTDDITGRIGGFGGGVGGGFGTPGFGNLPGFNGGGFGGAGFGNPGFGGGFNRGYNRRY
uniref:Putative secreted glycine-rich salivary protein n=1 Tax=Ornithodoros coriaceus TaxID=92741 RepID=B2D267_ORNCO|nr:putative secreted glycine-rich salivary protein [Ornithodoros coriaceus]